MIRYQPDKLCSGRKKAQLLITFLLFILMIGCTPAEETAVITSTPTVVLTPTLTATAVSTHTPTVTATPSSTLTPTPTDTPIPTDTPTPTPTATRTRKPTATPTFTPSTFDYDRYRPDTLAGVIEEFEEEIIDESDQNMLLYPYVDVRVSVIYTGESRPISEDRLALWATFLFAFLGDRAHALANLYETEYRFSEKGVDYWMPVQTPLIPFLEDEAKAGQEITLFIKWIGVNNLVDRDEIDWVFWVNEFRVDNE